MDVIDSVPLPPLPKLENNCKEPAVTPNQSLHKLEDFNTLITNIINLCEKHVFGQTASVQGILNVCSRISGCAGYDQFCRQIIGHCNEILSQTYENSHNVINLCTKISAFDVNFDLISPEQEVNQQQDSPAKEPEVTPTPNVKIEPDDDDVLTEPDISSQDQELIGQTDSDSEEHVNEDDDPDWSITRKKSRKSAEKSAGSDKSNSKIDSGLPKPSTKEYTVNIPKSTKISLKQDQKIYSCSVCSKKFSTSAGHKQHEDAHKSNGSLQCDICNRTFGSFNSLKRHGRVHTGERPYICEICGNSYPVLSTLRRHMLVHTDDTPFHCQLCEIKFKSAKRLRKHQQVHTGEKKYQCDTCGDRFAWSCSLKKHVMTAHSNESPFQCDICHKKFKMLRYLKKHALVHKDEYKFQCKVCGKQTHQKSNLDTHMRTHNGEKPYVCDKCGKRFTHNVTRKQHMESCFTQRNDFEASVSSLTSNSLAMNANFLSGLPTSGTMTKNLLH